MRGEEPRLTRYSVRVIGRPYNYVTDRAKRELGNSASNPNGISEQPSTTG
ncbi:MAG: hypothetical protein JRH01_24675 [Deltaproteobacteria bacterium]|nr:hypothetical protein [Deltaproteobacteria bacterium]